MAGYWGTHDWLWIAGVIWKVMCSVIGDIVGWCVTPPWQYAQSLFLRSTVAATTTSSAESRAWHSASRAGCSSPAMTTSIAMSGTHWGPNVQVLFADMYLGQYSCFLVISEKTWRTNDALRVWGQELVAHSEGYVHTFLANIPNGGTLFEIGIPDRSKVHWS